MEQLDKVAVSVL